MGRILTFNHKIINPGNNRYFGSFQCVPTLYTITIVQPTYGTITAPQSAHAGDIVTLSCTPDTGYVLQYFTVNGSQIQSDSFIMPDSDVTVSASMDAQIPSDWK